MNLLTLRELLDHNDMEFHLRIILLALFLYVSMFIMGVDKILDYLESLGEDNPGMLYYLIAELAHKIHSSHPCIPNGAIESMARIHCPNQQVLLLALCLFLQIEPIDYFDEQTMMTVNLFTNLKLNGWKNVDVLIELLEMFNYDFEPWKSHSKMQFDTLHAQFKGLNDPEFDESLNRSNKQKRTRLFQSLLTMLPRKIWITEKCKDCLNQNVLLEKKKRPSGQEEKDTKKKTKRLGSTRVVKG